MPHDLPTTLFTAGHPIFDTAPLRQLQASQGDAAAWCALFSTEQPARALSRVGGDFALALRLANGHTLLAIDRFAVQTLCYRLADGQLRWDARADRLGAGAADIDPQALFDYLHAHCIPSPRTVFKGVQRLPPAHMAIFDGRQLAVSAYWRPVFEPLVRPDFDGLRQRFLDAALGAVKRQLDGSKPACFLSGGTDSSTIAGLIGKAAGQPAATFSIGFEAQGYDEMAFARIAARQFGTEHHEYYVTPDDLVRSIADVGAHHDQPFGNSSALPAYYCALKARESGVTRLLAGDGGDELYGGNSRYAKQRVFGWYQHLPQGLRRGVMEPLLGRPAVPRLPLLKKASSYVEQARVPMPDRLQMYNLLLRLGLREVLSPALLAQVDVALPARQQREVYAAAQADAEIDRMLAFDWRYTLAESDLPKVRGAVELAGIDVGFPMLDQDLLGLALQLPANYKLRGLKLRWFFKEALRGFLPDEILTKKKQGFGLPFGVWATQHPALNALAVDALRSLGTRQIVQPAFIDALVREHLPAHPGYYGEMVWILMMLEQWLRAHAPDFRLQA